MKKVDEPIIVSKLPISWGTYSSYTVGFLLSMILTFFTYGLVELVSKHQINTSIWITISLLLLAVMQLFVQLYFFLHLTREPKPHWNLKALLFAVLVVIIIVGGSLWIMYNLNYRMTPDQLNKYLHSQDGL